MESISFTNIEQKQIDGLKRFYKKMKRMNLFSVTLILLLVGLGVYNFCTNYINTSTIFYYVLFPICMISLYLFTEDKGNMKSAEKKDYIITALSFVLTLSGIVFMLYAMNRVVSGKKVFSMENAQLGPFINMVWGTMFLFSVIGFVYLLLRMIHNKIYNQSMICIQMMGMFLLLAYVTLLSRLDSSENFNRLFIHVTVVIGVTGLLGSIIFAVIRHKSK